MSRNHFTAAKAMADRLDWNVSFELPLSKDDDTIIAVEATVKDGDSFLWETTAEIVDGQNVRLWLSGGLPGETYHINLTARTERGRTINLCICVCIGRNVSSIDNWTSPDFINRWADRIFNDCFLGATP